MAENTSTESKTTASIRYFWLLTLQWPIPGGFGTASFHSTLDTAGPVHRSEILPTLKQLAHDKGVPANATVTYLSIEPDLIAAGVTR